MSDTTHEAPERIWATGDNRNGSWTCKPLPEKWSAKPKEYVRADRIEELEAAIKRQAGAARTVRQYTLKEVQHLSEMDRSEYFAVLFNLISERDANAMLIDRIEELEAENKRLRLEAAHANDTANVAIERVKELDAMAKVLVEAMVVPEAWMVSGFPDMSSEAKEQITASVMQARTTLAELKGRDDE